MSRRGRRHRNRQTNPSRDDDLYNLPGFTESKPNITSGQNFDFAGFIPLVKAVYWKMERMDLDIRRHLPFCIFQHAMTEILTARMLFLGDYRLDAKRYYEGHYIPLPIYLYIEGIGRTVTADGTQIDWNLPKAAIPQKRIEGEMPCRSGSFGIPTAENHNAYECYISPYITSEYVKRQATVTKETKNLNWNPFPNGWLPAGCEVNENLLGYHALQKLYDEEELRRCSECTFEDNDTFYGILCHSPEAMHFSSNFLSISSVKSVKAQFDRTQKLPDVAFKEYQETESLNAVLWRESSTMYSPYPVSAKVACKSSIFGYKRKRNAAAPGVLALCNGKIIDGWLETINDNFECRELFGFRHRLHIGDANHHSGYSDRWQLYDWLTDRMMKLTMSHQRIVIQNRQANPSRDDYDSFSSPGFRDSVPIKSFGQNFDFGGFIHLVKSVYMKMMLKRSFSRRKQLPFCIFQHAMTEILTARMLFLADNRFDAKRYYEYQYIPLPIYLYIEGIGRTVTANGTQIHWNLPKAAIPQKRIEGEMPCRSGSFGIPTAENHNAYECYISPYITSEYVKRQATVTKETENLNWNPFPNGWLPAGCEVNENLLGYHALQNLSDEELRRCSECTFQDNDTLYGILCHSPEAMTFSSNFLSISSVKSVKAQFDRTQKLPDVAFKEYQETESLNAVLWRESSTMYSPYPVSAKLACKSSIFGYKRKRNAAAPGVLALCNGKIIDGWLETINDNFECRGLFGLRHRLHIGGQTYAYHHCGFSNHYLYNWLTAYMMEVQDSTVMEDSSDSW